MAYYLFGLNYLVARFFFQVWRNLWLPFVYHVFYFWINLQAVLLIEREKELLFGYGLSALWLLWAGVKEVLKNFPLDEALENYFSFNFKLINLRQLQPIETPEPPRQNLFFGHWLRPWRIRRSLYSILLLAALVAFLPVQLIYLSRFKENLSAVVGLRGDQKVVLDIPKTIKEDEALSAFYQGDYLKGVLDWEMGGRTGSVDIVSGENQIIARTASALKWKAVFRKGRLVTQEEGKVELLYKPRLSSISTEVSHPEIEAKELYEGVTEIAVLPGSRIEIKVSINEDQRLSSLHFLKGSAKVYPLANKNEKKISLLAKEDFSLRFRLVNGRGQWGNEEIELTFTVLDNLAPIVSIMKPPANLRVGSRKDIQGKVVATDDLALKKLRMRFFHYVSYQKQPLKTGVISYDSAVKSKVQVIHPFVLSLNALDVFPGNRVKYVFEVEDLYGLKASSKTHTIYYLSMAELFASRERKTAQAVSQIQGSQNHLGELKRELEGMQVEAEKGDLDVEQIKEFGNKLEKFQTSLQEKKEEIESLGQEQTPQASISENTLKKLKEIKEMLESIDKDFLRELNQRLEPLLKDLHLRPEEITKAYRDFLTNDLEKKLDETLRAIEQLKELEKMENLKQLAENLFRQHEDLRAYTASKDDPSFYNKNKQEIENLFEDLNEVYRENSKALPQEDPESKRLKKELDGLLKKSQVDAYRAFQYAQNKNKELNAFSETFRKIKENLNLLSKRSKALDVQKAIEEISQQVSGFLSQTKWMRDFVDDEVMDLQISPAQAIRKRAGDFIAHLDKYTLREKRDRYELMAGHIPGILDLFEKIDNPLLSNVSVLKKKLDPASSMVPLNLNTLMRELDKLRRNYLAFVDQLLKLKAWLLNQQKQDSIENAMSDALQQQQSMSQSRQKAMGKSSSLNQQQLDFLRQSALEQAFIRSLMEGVRDQMEGRRTGKGENGQQQGEGSGQQQGEGMLNELKEIIEEMKSMEEDLQNIQPQDSEKILAKQKRIEANLKKFNKGLKSQEKRKKDDKRTATTAKRQHTGSDSKIDDRLRYLIEGLENRRGKQTYPKLYEDRIRHYIDKLKEESAKP